MPVVLHVTQPTTAGVAAVVRQLASAPPPGWSAIVVSPRVGDLRDWCRRAGVEWRPLDLERGPTWRDLLHIWRLRRIGRSVDVVHLHSSKAGFVGRLAMVGLRRRPGVIYSPHAWSWVMESRATVAYRWIEKVLARHADVLVAVSDAERSEGRRVLGGGVRIEAIANGVDLRSFPVPGPVADRPAQPLVVCVGRLCRQKGQDRAIAALARLDDQSVVLRLVGDGPDRALLEALAVQLGVRRRVEFIGHADPRPHLRAADLVVLPSRWEGMSLALLEAMALGRAIVTTACAGSEALGSAGVVLQDPSDDRTIEDGLIDAVDWLLGDPQTRSALGSAAQSRVRSQYDADSVVARHAVIWQELAAGRDSRG